MTIAVLDRPIRPLAPFDARVDAEGPSTVITLRGEADILVLDAVIGPLARVIAEREGPVIVDLADLSFIDMGTVRALGRAAQVLARRDRTLTIREPSAMALRLLAFLGLDEVIRIGPPQHERRPGAPALARR